MKPLIVLLISFLISLALTWFLNDQANLFLSGKIGMSAMLLFTSIGHFKFTKGMSLMIPSFIPFKKEIIFGTGVIEVMAAVGILLTTTSVLTGVLLIIFFVLILPANIYASLKHINLEKGTYDGNGIKYLWFRIPLQFLFIAWIYYFVVASEF